jgi:uncharacterized protein (DUF433 family)
MIWHDGWKRLIDFNRRDMPAKKIVVGTRTGREPSSKTSKREKDRRAFNVPLKDLFLEAVNECSHIDIDPERMAGTPCATGTRIPVYAILREIDALDVMRSVSRAYPHLNVKQVIDALNFAERVIECPVD